MSDDASAIRFEAGSGPLVEVTFAAEQSAADIDGFCRELDRLVKRPDLYVMLVDVQKLSASVENIRALGRWTQQNGELVTKNCAGIGVVLHSEAMRFMLSAFVPLAPFPVPTEFFKTREEALAYVREQARSKGLFL
jgi:hypothetical protein